MLVQVFRTNLSFAAAAVRSLRLTSTGTDPGRAGVCNQDLFAFLAEAIPSRLVPWVMSPALHETRRGSGLMRADVATACSRYLYAADDVPAMPR